MLEGIGKYLPNLFVFVCVLLVFELSNLFEGFHLLLECTKYKVHTFDPGVYFMLNVNYYNNNNDIFFIDVDTIPSLQKT